MSKPLTHNYLFICPPRNTFLGEYLCVGDGSQLDTQIERFTPDKLHKPISLPNICPQPRILVEWTIHVGADHPLANWPEPFTGFRPVTGSHAKTFGNWFRSRSITVNDNDAFLVWQQVIAPCERMSEVFSTILSLAREASRAGAYFTTNKASVEALLEKLPK